MPGNDAVLFFSETHVVEVKEIIMSGVFLADAVESLAGCFLQSCRPGSLGPPSESTQGHPEPQLGGVVGITQPVGRGPCFPVIQHFSSWGSRKLGGHFVLKI